MVCESDDLQKQTTTVTTPAFAHAGFSKRSALLGGLLAFALVFTWLFLIHNRFFTPHEGWFSNYGLLMKNGKFPYRDFYFFTQPISLLISRSILEFGDKLIYFRYYGLAERGVLTLALYVLLSRQFSAAAAVCGTVAASFFFVSYSTDALFTYIYTCLLFFLLALVCLQEAWARPEKRLVWMGLSGTAAALSFWTKQSNGLLAVAAVFASICFMAGSWRKLRSDAAAFSAGLIVATAPFICWLVQNHAMKPYLVEVFAGAASSKGGLYAIFLGFLGRQIQVFPLICFAIPLAILFRLRLKKAITWHIPAGGVNNISPALTFVGITLSVLIAVATVRRIDGLPVFLLRYCSFLITSLSMYSLPLLLGMMFWWRFAGSGRQSREGYEVPAALLISSFFWAYGCGMSWAVEEQSAIPSLGLFLAFAYDRIRIGNGGKMKAIVLVAAMFIICLGVWQKWNVAFNWEGWRERISVDNAHSHWEPIHEYALDKDEAAMYDAIFDDIERYTKPGDEVATFSTIPLFNFVNRRPQPTFAAVHYWDVCPDNVAGEDAKKIERARPRMIVNLKLADWVWKEHDEGWRGGRRSGQRDYQDALDRLASSGDYRLLHKYSTPFYKMDLNVWLREK